MNIFETNFEDISTTLGVNIKLLEIVAQDMEAESFAAARIGGLQAFSERVREVYVPCINEMVVRIGKDSKELQQEVQRVVETRRGSNAAHC